MFTWFGRCQCSLVTVYSMDMLATVSFPVSLARSLPAAGLWSPGKTSGWSCQRLKRPAAAALLPPAHLHPFYLGGQSLNDSVFPLCRPCLTSQCLPTLSSETTTVAAVGQFRFLWVQWKWQDDKLLTTVLWSITFLWLVVGIVTLLI